MTPRSRPHSILERAHEYLASAISSPHARGIGNTEKYVINTETGLVRLLDGLRDAEEVALDLETSGLDPFADTVEVVSLAAHTPDGLLNELVCARALDLSPLLDLLSGKDLLLFNAKFDLKFLMRRFGYFHRGKVHDLMISFLMVYYGIEGERTARSRGCLRVPDLLDKKRPKGEKVQANLRFVADRYLGAEKRRWQSFPVHQRRLGGGMPTSSGRRPRSSPATSAASGWRAIGTETADYTPTTSRSSPRAARAARIPRCSRCPRGPILASGGPSGPRRAAPS